MKPTASRSEWIASLVIVGLVVACTAAYLVTRHASPGAPAPSEGAAAAPEPSPATPSPAIETVIAPPPSVRQGTILDASQEPSMAGLDVTRVTIDFNDLFLPAACEALSTASSIAVQPGPGILAQQSLPTASLHLKDAPFMEALLELRHQTGAVVSQTPTQPTSEGVTFTSLRPGASVGRWCICGPFAVIFQSISRDIELATGQPGQLGGRMTLELAAEPACNIGQLSPSIAIDTFVDENGLQIPLRSASVSSQLSNFVFFVQFPPNQGRRIALLHGVANISLVTKTDQVKAASLAETTLQPVAGMKVEISPVTHSSNFVAGPANSVMFEVTIRFSRGDMPVDRWRRVSALNNLAIRPVVYTAADRSLPVLPAGFTGHGTDSVLATYNIRVTAGAGDPDHLTLAIPIETREVHVPFEFKDLILP